MQRHLGFPARMRPSRLRARRLHGVPAVALAVVVSGVAALGGVAITPAPVIAVPLRHVHVAAQVTPAPGGGGNASASVASAWQAVRYHNVQVQVPASWPVRDLTTNPLECLRLDQHALYLGHQGPRAVCPAGAVGRTETVQITALDTAALEHLAPRLVASTLNGSAVLTDPASATTRMNVIVYPSAGVVVRISSGVNPALADQIMASLRIAPNVAAPPGALTANALLAPRTVAPVVGGVTLPGANGATVAGQPAVLQASGALTPQGPLRPQSTGSGASLANGFDTCAAPSTSTLTAWMASPYRSLGVYIGGANRACGDGNLSSSWVRQVSSQGWGFIPLYVGLQAPCVGQPGLATIDPSQAAAQGQAAAVDAVNHAQSFGIGAGSPIYYDMENYDATNAGCIAAVDTFLSAWTVQLHQLGYRSGVYGGLNSTIQQLEPGIAPAGTVQPDAIDFAAWDNNQATMGYGPTLPDTMWNNGQRIHQYSGGTNQTYGGITLNLDGDAVQAPLAGGGGVAPGLLPPAPVISSITPTSVSAGEQVTITGTNFGALQGSGYVAFQDGGVNWGAPVDGANWQLDSWSNNQIVFTVPSPSGSGGMWAITPNSSATVSVTDSVGLSSSGESLSIAGPPPTISSVTPSPVVAGQQVTITGTNFGPSQGAGYVSFHDNGVNWGAPGDGASWQVDSWSNSQIVFTVPTPSGAGGAWAVTPTTFASLQVTNAGGQSSGSSSLVIGLPPTISAITPVAASGQQVTITGTNFGAAQGAGYVAFRDNGVSWGAPGNAATWHVDSWSNNQIVFTVPSASGPGGAWAVTPGTTAAVTVTNAVGQVSPTTGLAVVVAPTITNVTSGSVTPGEQVTVNGTNFGASQGAGYVSFHDNNVNWGAPGNAATWQIDSWSNNQIVFTVPSSSGPGGAWAVAPGTTATLSVTDNAGVSSGNAAVLVAAPVPATFHPVAAVNTNGTGETFAVGHDGNLWHDWQCSTCAGGWSGWSQLAPGPFIGNPVVSVDASGRLTVVVRAASGQVVAYQQSAASSGPWVSVALAPQVVTADVTVLRWPDGRLELFGVAPGGQLVHCWQVAPNGAWSAWLPLGGSAVGQPSVALNSNGTPEVFVRTTSNALDHTYYSPTAGWSPMGPVLQGMTITSDPTVAANSDGRLEVFAQQPGGQVVHAYQAAPSAGPWIYGGALAPQAVSAPPTVMAWPNGRLELFATANGQAVHLWQLAPNGAGGWTPSWLSLGGPVNGLVATAPTAQGLPQLYASNGAGWLETQSWNGTNWTGWRSLGGPF